METVAPGEAISFFITVTDDDGAAHDPDSLSVYITRFVDDILYGPATYESGEVTRLSEGLYSFSFVTSGYTLPAVYTLKSVAVTDDTTQYYYDYFELIEPMPTKSGLLDPPRLYGRIRETYNYGPMGIGLTDHICLVGHSDGININDPIHVTNMKEVVRMLNGDSASPLLRALLEAYNAGARDITIVAAAPMSEYMPDVAKRDISYDEWGDKTFYEKYYDRLTDTYETLSGYDYYDLIIPVEAVFADCGDVDFLSQLADYCASTFSETANPVIGLLGTRSNSTTDDFIATLLADTRLDSDDWLTKGKFVSIIAGEGLILNPQMTSSYGASLAVTAAATLATQDYGLGLTYRKLKEVVSLVGRDFTDEEAKQLAQKRINPAIRTKMGRRGTKNNVVIATDNTASPEGSDYWSIATIRLVSQLIKDIRRMSSIKIGKLGISQLRSDIDNYLKGMVQSKYIQAYQFELYRSSTVYGKAVVEVNVTPYLQVREVTFQTLVGTNE